MISVFRAVGMAAAAVLFMNSAADGLQRKKKQEEEITQTLELPPDPPAAVTADPSRLAFLQGPLSAQGLLSRQTREALRLLIQNARGARFVRIRAYVAGTGDLRRVQSIVAETFAEKKQPLPVLTVAQVGALPLEGAQVQLEAVIEQRKPAGAGTVFAASESPSPQGALDQIQRTLQQAEALSDAPISLVCGVSSGDQLEPLRRAAYAAFPRAAFVSFQLQRIPGPPLVACQAAASIARPVAGGVRRLGAGVAVSAPRIILSGAQLAFRYEESDARLAYQRLDRTLQQAGASLKHALLLNVYPLSAQLAELAARIRSEFVNTAQPPAGLVVPLEGLPSIDGAFALEAVALPAPGA
jgi:enamine deaminase RidA (YjgF/YER057c/UK114 family)